MSARTTPTSTTFANLSLGGRDLGAGTLNVGRSHVGLDVFYQPDSGHAVQVSMVSPRRGDFSSFYIPNDAHAFALVRTLEENNIAHLHSTEHHRGHFTHKMLVPTR